MKKFMLLLALTVLTLAGLALILPAAAQWDALQIQAGLGNSQPLTAATLKMAGGLACLALVWFSLKVTRNMENQ